MNEPHQRKKQHSPSWRHRVRSLHFHRPEGMISDIRRSRYHPTKNFASIISILFKIAPRYTYRSGNNNCTKFHGVFLSSVFQHVQKVKKMHLAFPTIKPVMFCKNSKGIFRCPQSCTKWAPFCASGKLAMLAVLTGMLRVSILQTQIDSQVATDSPKRIPLLATIPRPALLRKNSSGCLEI